MSEETKYDSFISELISLEKQIYILIQKNQGLAAENLRLSQNSEDLKREIELLKIKLEDVNENLRIMNSSRNSLFNNGLNPEEKEIFKNKLDDLISRIDKHLSS